MDEFEMKRKIYGCIKEICHYSQKQVFATSYYQKNYFQMQIDDATGALISLYTDLWKSPERQQGNRKNTDRERGVAYYELASFDAVEIPQQGATEPEAGGVPQPETRIITTEELADYNGKEGRPAYVALNGIVYDVSNLVRWAGGNHFGLVAGKDLSGPFMGCHQGIMDRLNKVPKVGILE